MNRFLKYWRLQGKGKQWRAHVVAYADDFVILSRGHAGEAREWTQGVMSRIGLTLNEQKTSIRDARREEFDFLGYTFGRRYSVWNAKPYMAARPSKKSILRLTGKVYDLLRPHEKGPWPEVCARLNAQLQGWRQYFSYGTIARSYQIVNTYVEKRVRNFLRQRHKHSTLGTRRFPSQLIFGKLGVVRLARRGTACAS
jgi:RNA-directed DNA polymerase